MLLSGKVPFEGKNNDAIRDAILGQDLKFEKAQWGHISVYASNFVSNCLRKNIAERSTVAELLQHRWIKDNVKAPTLSREIQTQLGQNLISFQ
jgi:myosin-light-chain kinase